MSNLSKDSILTFLRQYAPKAPLDKALELASNFEYLKNEEYRLKTMLAILAETVVGISEQGEVPEELVRKFKDNKAVLTAIKEVQYCHSWVVCGPAVDAMEKLYEEVGKTAKQNDINWLLRNITKEENKD